MNKHLTSSRCSCTGKDLILRLLDERTAQGMLEWMHCVSLESYKRERATARREFGGPDPGPMPADVGQHRIPPPTLADARAASTSGAAPPPPPATRGRRRAKATEPKGQPPAKKGKTQTVVKKEPRHGDSPQRWDVIDVSSDGEPEESDYDSPPPPPRTRRAAAEADPDSSEWEPDWESDSSPSTPPRTRSKGKGKGKHSKK